MMKRQYTEQEMNLFFTRFKQLPEYFEIEKVHQLINNPCAKATHRVNFKYKPFKFIIMTSILIVGISSFLLWLNPNFESQKKMKTVLQTIPFGEKTDQIVNTGKESKAVENQTRQSNHSNNKTVYEIQETDKNKVAENDTTSILQANYGLISSNKNIETFWPEDTLIDGDKFIVTLTDKELENIGFELDETGIYYKNDWNGNLACFHALKRADMGITRIISYLLPDNKKATISNYDFYPIQISTTTYSPWIISKDEFSSSNDTLIPILIKNEQLKYGYDDLIIWFDISKTLFEHLPERYKKLENEFQKIIEFKRRFIKSDIVKYKAKNITDEMKFIELSKNELEKLNIKINNTKMNFGFYDDKVYLNFYLSYREVGVSIVDDTLVKRSGIEIDYLSNESGDRPIQWNNKNDPDNKNSLMTFIDNAQNLVPVILRKSDYPKILYENHILWFKPSEALFDSLPESIGNQLRMEYNYISAETDEQRIELTTNCTYFEACKSTLKVENCKLYPNPASTSATLEFSLPESAIGNISLANISGAQLKILVPTTSFIKGNNSFKFDVSEISPGIYLVLIKTDKGFKTQRLIISK